jgi:uncharacterized Fe-S center protein
MTATVYFAGLRARNSGDSKIRKIRRLLEAVGLEDVI